MAFPTSIELASYFGIPYNNLSTTLSQIAGISDTTIYVASTDNFDAIGEATVEDEIFYHTGKTAGSFTGCTRGYGNTTAAEHAAGKQVSLTFTATMWARIVAELRAALTALGITGAFNFVAKTGAETIAGVKTFSSIPIGAGLVGIKANEIIIMAAGFNINGSSATLVDTAGTAAKCYAQHISALKTYWFDCPKFLVPENYDGGSIVITVCWRCAAASKKHSLGIRVASVPTGSPHNPDLAAAFQLYNEVSSDATIGDVTILSTTVTQANHLMVAGQIWHCKFVVEDDAGCDADATLFDWIRIKWNKV